MPLLLLIGKYVFLALLYLFIYVLFRQMFAELRPAGGAQHVVVRPAAAAPEFVPATPDVPPVARAAPALVVIQSPNSQELPVGAVVDLGPMTTIGRAEGSSLRLPDRFISSRHAIIVQAGGRYRLRDEGSTNGTFLNGQRVVAEMTLQDGDEVEIGATILEFRESAGSGAPR